MGDYKRNFAFQGHHMSGYTTGPEHGNIAWLCLNCISKIRALQIVYPYLLRVADVDRRAVQQGIEGTNADGLLN